MKRIILILFLSIATNIMAQKDNTWHAYFAEDGFTRGFKNEQGKVMISPKFKGFTWAKKFKNIIAVMEGTDFDSAYYLLKNGTKVGKDSVYIWDMAFDCESEGMIRFRDPKTDKVGFFDSNGKVAIPALYAEALSFHNGVAVVYDGERMCEDGTVYDKNNPCDHWILSENTNTLLIDKKNNILINDFKYNFKIDLYSMKENDTTALPYRLTQVGSNNNYYSFNNYEKQFEIWLKDDFIKRLEFICNSAAGPSVTQHTFIENSTNKIAVWNQSNEDMKMVQNKPFLRDNYKVILDKFLAFKNVDTDYFISISGLNAMIWEGAAYQKYFDDCGEALETKYPVLTLIINRKNNAYQEHFTFLKTDTDFKLIGINSPNIIIN